VLDGYAVADEIVYIVGENLYALDASSGLEYWRYPLDTSSLIHTTRLVAGDGRIFLTYNVNSLLAIGNLGLARLLTDVTLRSTPSGSGAERGSARAGDEISRLGERLERGGVGWVEVTINNVTGWIPLDVIDPASLPPEGEIDYVYTPA